MVLPPELKKKYLTVNYIMLAINSVIPVILLLIYWLGPYWKIEKNYIYVVQRSTIEGLIIAMI